MSKVSKLAAALAVVPVVTFAVPAFADSPGDLAGGADIYQVRLMPNGSYTNTLTATCDQLVKYSVKLSNTDFSQLSDVTVKASLTGGDMTATAKNANGDSVSTSGKVTVTVKDGSLQYVAGTTKLYTVDGAEIKTLDDGVTTSGVDAGTLNGSTREFLQFQAKVKCETPPAPKQIQVCELSTKKVVTINESEFNTSKYSKDLSKCKETPVTPATPTTPTTPTELPHTGAGSIVAIVSMAAAAVAGLAHRAFSVRRANR